MINIIANDVDESVAGVDKIHGYKKLHTVCDTIKSFFDKKYELAGEGGEFVNNSDMEFHGCLIDDHSYYDDGNLDTKNLLDTNKKASEAMEHKVDKIIKKGNKPLVVGGSHGLTYNTIKAIKKNIPEDIGLMYFDSHNDCEDYCKIPLESPSRCSWVKKIVEDKLIKPENIIFVNGAPTPEESPCNKRGSIQINKTIDTIINPEKNDEYYNRAEKSIEDLSKKVKKLFLSYDRDFNKKEGVAIPAYTDKIENQFEIDVAKEKGLEIIGADIQEYFPPAEITSVGLFGAFPRTRTDLKYNILDMIGHLKD